MISRSCDKGNGNNKHQINVRETKTGSTAVGTRVKNSTISFTVRTRLGVKMGKTKNRDARCDTSAGTS